MHVKKKLCGGYVKTKDKGNIQFDNYKLNDIDFLKIQLNIGKTGQ